MTTTGTFTVDSTNDVQFEVGKTYRLSVYATTGLSASVSGEVSPPAPESETPPGDGEATETVETPGDAPDSPSEPTTPATP